MKPRKLSTELHLFYDSECSICVRLKSAVSRLDREGIVELIDLHNKDVCSRFPDLDPVRALTELTAVDHRGEFFCGGAVLQRLGNLLPGIRHLNWVYQLPGMISGVSMTYRILNRQRRRLCLKCGQKWTSSAKYSQRKRHRWWKIDCSLLSKFIGWRGLYGDYIFMLESKINSLSNSVKIVVCWWSLCGLNLA